MDYKEMAHVVSKVWINSDDIMKICNCGKNTAIKIRQDVEKTITGSVNVNLFCRFLVKLNCSFN